MWVFAINGGKNLLWKFIVEIRFFFPEQSFFNALFSLLHENSD